MAVQLEEMDRLYGAAPTEPLAERLRQINEALFASPPVAYALLAWDGTQLAGFAVYSFLWPAVGLTRSLFLRELYVADDYRRRGVGKLLMQTIFDVADRHECSRIEWTTDRDNSGALAFYATLGLSPHTTKVFYRVEDTGTGLQLSK
jgi:GNAT superfamily N-acetyltransferase